ncbi:spore germination protein KA [Paenibacillus montaniterrae]|uniref:Spore germination protein KA n=1 Tax=Paenibacillus montaniterrae TaxID=429341 RepID=A0A919YP15_9BACL|nr:spore germination protein [Paenibacillus montaniterrae]GIP16765.1 spore germination protein KA [Paenibacillus montaniterrae]
MERVTDSINENAEHSGIQQKQKQPLQSELQANIDLLLGYAGYSDDIVIRRFGGDHGIKEAVILYVEGLTDRDTLMNNIIKPLQFRKPFASSVIDELKQLVSASDLKEAADTDYILQALFSGDTIILMHGEASALVASSKGGEKRPVSEPATQTIIRGPRESFTENLSTNTALIRRKVKDANLWLETMQIGRVTKTKVGIMYIQGLVQPSIITEIKQRLNQIDIDGILEGGYVEEFIQDKTFTPFPTIQNTDRPDSSAAALLEGRVVIIIDGSPFVLLAPALFVQFFQASEDYYHRWDISTLIRGLRFLSFAIALLAPSLYVAVTTYHQELIPSSLLFALASQREGAPFPAFIEAFIMEIMFEVLREAGIRMGRAVGSSVSIVGTLVIGQAAVEAGLVTAAMVIVVSSTAIANFVSPSFNMGISTRLLRFGFMALAASLGLYGITIGLIILALHLCHLTSFGIPYMSSLAPYYSNDQKDALFRFPHWLMKKRPQRLSNWNEEREQTVSVQQHQMRDKD